MQLGFLYLRYVGQPNNLLSWMEPYFADRTVRSALRLQLVTLQFLRARSSALQCIVHCLGITVQICATMRSHMQGSDMNFARPALNSSCSALLRRSLQVASGLPGQQHRRSPMRSIPCIGACLQECTAQWLQSNHLHELAFLHCHPCSGICCPMCCMACSLLVHWPGMLLRCVQRFWPSAEGKGKQVTFGAFVADLLLSQHYFETIFTRIPKKINDEVTAALEEKGLTAVAVGNGGQGGSDRRGGDDGRARPASVKVCATCGEQPMLHVAT